MIIFLLPPSEGKKEGGILQYESLSYAFPKPLEIAQDASEKDLQCTGKRYDEAIKLNRALGSTADNQAYMKAIERYTGVMFKAIDYVAMDQGAQKYFDDHFVILSGLYGAVKPQDYIANYKLPIGAKGLYAFWGKRVTDILMHADVIVDLLPGAHKKMIDFDALREAGKEVLTVDFFARKDSNKKITKKANQKVNKKDSSSDRVKLTHGVKKVKGQWIREVCARQCSTSEQIKNISFSSDISLRFS